MSGSDKLWSGDMIHLTDRQLLVLCAAANGRTSVATGTMIGIASETVRKHRSGCIAALGASCMTQAVATAIRLGLIEWHEGMGLWLPPSS